MSFVQNTADKAKAWGQSIFTIDPNATPEQIERKRQIIAAMMPRGDAKYVGAGLADLAKGIAMGVKGRRMDKFEGEKRKEASDAFRGALGRVPAPQGPMSILGMNPDWGAEQSFVQQPESGPQQMPVNPSPDVAGAFAGAAGGLPGSLIRTESGGNLRALNSEGYGGRGQFGAERLADAARAGIIPAGMTGAEYSQQPEEVQLAVENWHKADILRNVGQYVGVDVDGAGPIPPLTENSLLAVAHLGGTGGAKKFVESGGRYNPSDSNGTSLADYATTHAGGPAGAAGPAPAGFGGLSVPQYSGPPIADLQAALMNPWLSAGEKQMAASMLDRAMQQGDPAYQLGLQKQQLEIANMTQPARPKPIEINGQLVDPETGQVLGDYRDEAGAGGTEYGLSPQYGVDAEGNPTIIQIGKDGTAVETQMPDGVTFQKEPIRIDAGTEWVLLDPISRQPIGSVPKNLAEAEEQKAAGAAQGKATAEASANLSTTLSKADQAVKLLREIRNDPALPGITGMVQGRIQPLSQAGTDLNVKIEQAKGQVFLEAFQMLKGGGAITEMEGQKAEQAIARMNRAQSLGAYQSAMDDMIAVIEAGKQRAAQKAGAGTPPEAPAGRRRYNPQTGEFE